MKSVLSFLGVLFFLWVGCLSLRAQSVPAAMGSGARSGFARTVRTVPLDSMRMSDPYILADPRSRTYYMTGTGGALWKSKDLVMWEGPYTVARPDTGSWMGRRPQIWAAELHLYQGKYYFFGTFTNASVIIERIPGRYDIPRRASHILVSDNAEGPYTMMLPNEYTPAAQATLDGTLWVEDGIPYMVYCHEWLQCINGTMDAVRLKADLSGPEGVPFTLFKASEGPWSREMVSIGELTYGLSLPGQVTDGPFLFRTQTGRLGMLWSSWGDQRYAQGVAYSASGKLRGPWIHEQEPLNPQNAGHGMLFRTFEGTLVMCLHVDRNGRKPQLLQVDDSGDRLRIVGPFRP